MDNFVDVIEAIGNSLRHSPKDSKRLYEEFLKIEIMAPSYEVRKALQTLRGMSGALDGYRRYVVERVVMLYSLIDKETEERVFVEFRLIFATKVWQGLPSSQFLKEKALLKDVLPKPIFSERNLTWQKKLFGRMVSTSVDSPTALVFQNSNQLLTKELVNSLLLKESHLAESS